MSAAVRVPALVMWLVVLWVGLWGDVSVANVASGLLVAAGVLVAGRMPRAEALHRSTIRPLAALRFLAYFLFKVVQANLILAREIVTPGSRIRTGIIAIPVLGLSDALITLLSNAVTLTPGSVVLEVRRRPEPTIYVHVLHLHDVDAVRRDVLHFEYLAVRAFGTVEARAALESRGVS